MIGFKNIWRIFYRLTWFSVPCVSVWLVLFSGEAWARGRAGRLACRSGGCDSPIFGSLMIIVGAVCIVGPFYPPLWRFLDEHGTDEKLKPICLIMGVFLVGFGIYLFR